MDRARRITDFWNWLPAFRAVAETGSLREAARRLHVAPSAISRTLRLLEEALGYPLFDRAGGALTVNVEGRRVLDGVRSAMRIVDDATSDPEVGGPVRIHCPVDVARSLLLGVIDDWIARNPTRPPIVDARSSEGLVARLLRGELDVVIEFEAAQDPAVESVLLGEFTSGVYGLSSPAAVDDPPRALSERAFVDYPMGPLGFLRVMKAPDEQRAAFAPSMDFAVQLAARGHGLVAAPDFVVAAIAPELGQLAALPSGAVYAWCRRGVPGGGAHPFVEHLAAASVFGTLRRAPRSAAAAVKRPRPRRRGRGDSRSKSSV